jgi:hypothetical protein
MGGVIVVLLDSMTYMLRSHLCCFCYDYYDYPMGVSGGLGLCHQGVITVIVVCRHLRVHIPVPLGQTVGIDRFSQLEPTETAVNNIA